MILGGGMANNATMFLLGTAGFAIGAPINHLANGHPKRALASFGIRTLAGTLAFGAVLLDVINHPCDGEPSCHHDPVAGLAVGALTLLTAMVVDDAALAREPVPVRPAKVTLTPGLLLGPNLALLSMGGRF